MSDDFIPLEDVQGPLIEYHFDRTTIVVNNNYPKDKTMVERIGEEEEEKI